MIAAQLSAYDVCRCSMRWSWLAVMPVSGHFRAQWVVRNAGNWSKASWEVKGHFKIVDQEPSCPPLALQMHKLDYPIAILGSGLLEVTGHIMGGYIIVGETML